MSTTKSVLSKPTSIDVIRTLCEFKCGSIIDTTSVDPQDKRLVEGTNVKISVKEINGMMRNKMKFV